MQVVSQTVGGRLDPDTAVAVEADDELANKLLGRLWWCWQNHQPWDDTAAWPALALAAEQTAA